jgi:hypothetical protein
MAEPANYYNSQNAPSVYADSKEPASGYANRNAPASPEIMVNQEGSDFNSFYKQYLDQRAAGASPTEDSLYTRNKDYYTLVAYGKAFGKKDDSWNSDLGFKPNESIIRNLYDYYQQTFNIQPGRFLWAGLGRMAGSAVLGGLLTPGLPDPSFLTKVMVLIGKTIFLDLAWQHELFVADPKRIVAMAKEHDIRFPAKTKYETAWAKIVSGGAGEVAEGNFMLLQNEQFSIIQPFYDTLKESSEAYPFSKTSVFTQNVHPYHLPFIESFTTTSKPDITVAADRWKWIAMDNGMWPKWIEIPPAERSRLVNLSMADLINRNWGQTISKFLPPGRP